MSVYVAGADGRGAKRLGSCGTCGEQYGSHLAWSPDGKRIAFTGNNWGKAGYHSLSVVAASGRSPHRLTDCRSSCVDFQPAWSPNGRRLVFARWSWTPRDFGLFTIRLDGSGLTRIASGLGDPEWSPDGRRILFDSPDGIAVVNADGSHLHVLLADRRAGPASWSPNGRKLVFFEILGPPGPIAEVWTMNADGSGKTRLYRSRCCTDWSAPPIWSPDGRMIAFSVSFLRSHSAGGTFVINADGSGLRRLSRIVASSLAWQGIPRH